MPRDCVLVSQVLSTHSRALWALVIVSSVVKVLDEMIKSVSSAPGRGWPPQSRCRDVRHKSTGDMADAVVAEQLISHDRAEVRASDADVYDIGDALSGVPFHSPLRT